MVLDGNNPSLIKIDVEGHEVEVLEGGQNTLTKIKPLLIIESFHPKQQTVLSILQEIGYKSIDADHYASIKPNTTNLFAWHPCSILQEASIYKLIN